MEETKPSVVLPMQPVGTGRCNPQSCACVASGESGWQDQVMQGNHLAGD